MAAFSDFLEAWSAVGASPPLQPISTIATVKKNT